MNENLENRESKSFWYADFAVLRVIEETGYKCEEDGQWWFPTLGWALWEGKQIFADKREAEMKIVETCCYQIPRYTEALMLYAKDSSVKEAT